MYTVKLAKFLEKLLDPNLSEEEQRLIEMFRELSYEDQIEFSEYMRKDNT